MSEKAVECSQCKRPVKVLYKEILDEGVLCTEMCADCPLLQEKLRGHPSKDDKTEKICCKTCKTSLESIRIGNPVGCTDCYVNFEDFLIEDLMSIHAIPPTLQKKLVKERVQNLHLGKSPHATSDATLPAKLLALNEALNDALKRENFEQAAWLRDQIKTLTGEQS